MLEQFGNISSKVQYGPPYLSDESLQNTNIGLKCSSPKKIKTMKVGTDTHFKS